MPRLLAVKNISREGLGRYVELLERRGIQCDVVDVSKGESIPDPTQYSGLIVLGGPTSANDATASMIDELAKVRRATDQSIPFLGLCLGAQVLVKANGGEIVRSTTKEVGFVEPARYETRPENNYVETPLPQRFFTISLTPDGTRDPIFRGFEGFQGFPSAIGPIFHLHGEMMSPADSMAVLATGHFCRVQVVRVGKNAYGFQGHFELNSEMLKQWLAEDPDLKKLDGTRLEEDFRRIKEAYQSIGERILENWLGIAELL